MELLDLPAFVPSAGILGVLLVLLVHTMRLASSDRRDYHTSIREYQSILSEQRESCRAEIADLRAQITMLRTDFEAERKARYEAEDRLRKKLNDD